MFGLKNDQILVLWFDSNENLAIQGFKEEVVHKPTYLENQETRRSFESDEIHEQSIHRTKEKVQIEFATNVKELFKNDVE